MEAVLEIVEYCKAELKTRFMMDQPNFITKVISKVENEVYFRMELESLINDFQFEWQLSVSINYTFLSKKMWKDFFDKFEDLIGILEFQLIFQVYY